MNTELIPLVVAANCCFYFAGTLSAILVQEIRKLFQTEDKPLLEYPGRRRRHRTKEEEELMESRKRDRKRQGGCCWVKRDSCRKEGEDDPVRH